MSTTEQEKKMCSLQNKRRLLQKTKVEVVVSED